MDSVLSIKWITADEIKPLVETGLGGIEVYHSYINDDARLYFMQVAQVWD
jgi:hypothetical protein